MSHLTRCSCPEKLYKKMTCSRSECFNQLGDPADSKIPMGNILVNNPYFRVSNMNHISILCSLPIAKPLFTSASFSSESHLVEFQCLLAVKWFSGRLSKTRTDGIPWGYSQLFVLANIDTSVGNRSRYCFFLTHLGSPEGLERYRAAELGKCTCH